METMGDRLRRAMAARKRTVKDIVAAKIMSKANVYLILNNTTGPDKIRDTTVTKLCRYLGIRGEWLTNGRGPMDAGLSEVQGASQFVGPDPAILREAVYFLLFDLERRPAMPMAQTVTAMLLDLYRRIEAAGGQLPEDEAAAFEAEANARIQPTGGHHGASKGRRGSR